MLSYIHTYLKCLQTNNTNQNTHLPWCGFPPVAVTANTVNRTVKRCALLVEMQLNDIRLFFNQIYCYLSIALIEVCRVTSTRRRKTTSKAEAYSSFLADKEEYANLLFSPSFFSFFIMFCISIVM